MTTQPIYERRREIAEELRAMNGENVLWILHDYINMGGDTPLRKAIEVGLRDWHPTLQQCLMRSVIKPAVQVMAKENSDDRNRSTVRMCQEILLVFEEHSLPFI